MTEQIDLLDYKSRYPSGPGYRHRDTSREAALAIAPRVETLRDRVYRAILARPGTAEEIAARLRESPLAIRLRTTELARLLLIEDSGERRANTSGRKAIVWRVPAQPKRMAA